MAFSQVFRFFINVITPLPKLCDLWMYLTTILQVAMQQILFEWRNVCVCVQTNLLQMTCMAIRRIGYAHFKIKFIVSAIDDKRRNETA